MCPLHLESLSGFISIRICVRFRFVFGSIEYPQRLAPHGSIRILPSFCSVSQMPSGELAGFAGAGGGAATGAVATTGGEAGLAGTASCWACGAGVLAAGGVGAGLFAGATFAVALEGAGAVLVGGGAAAGVCGSAFACSGAGLAGRLLSWLLRGRFAGCPVLS